MTSISPPYCSRSHPFPVPSVDNYFVTAHYLDQAVKEFFDYLKASGLYDDSVIVYLSFQAQQIGDEIISNFPYVTTRAFQLTTDDFTIYPDGMDSLDMIILDTQHFLTYIPSCQSDRNQSKHKPFYPFLMFLSASKK